MWRLIGRLHLPPSEAFGYTLRELEIMEDGRDWAEWDHTAPVCALLHNLLASVSTLFGGKMRGARMSDYHPFVEGKEEPQGMKLTPETLKLLATVLSQSRRMK